LPAPTLTTTTSPYDDVAVPLPDAPLGVQVDAGPQRGTLLVTWTPVPDKKPVDDEAAALIRAITGYAVYVDGTMVKQLDSPTGQSVDRSVNQSNNFRVVQIIYQIKSNQIYLRQE